MKRLLCFLCIAIPFISYGQYNLYVNEPEFLQIPDPPMNGYVEKAWWTTDHDYIYFTEADEVGAIIHPTRYFQDTAMIVCDYYYSYLAADGSMRAVRSTETFYITCKPVSNKLKETYKEIGVGSKYRLICVKGNAPYGSPTLIWKSDNDSVASVDSDGYVTGKSVGVAHVTCDPQNGPILSCEVRVCENPTDDGDDSDDSSDSPEVEAYKSAIQRINSLELRTKDMLLK